MAGKSKDGPAKDLQPVADVMRMLADGTRLKLLMMLASRGEINVTALCEGVAASQPTVSHHLGLLRMSGIVATRRHGQNVFYRLSADAPTPDAIRVAAGSGSVSVRRH
jgi:DNA-binding transcriptional ArsR family regulator